MPTSEQIEPHAERHPTVTVDKHLRDTLRRYASAGHAELSRRIAALDDEWDVERVLEANAAMVGLAGIAITATRGAAWSWLPSAVFSLLLQQAMQGWSPPIPILRRLGFRTRREIDMERIGLRLLRGDFEAVPRRDTTDATRRADAVWDSLNDTEGKATRPAPAYRGRMPFFQPRRAQEHAPSPKPATRIRSRDIHTENFLSHLRSKWQPESDEQMDTVLLSVLASLKWRISEQEAAPLFAHLPKGVVKAVDTAERHAFAFETAPAKKSDANAFFDKVTTETGLRRQEVERATTAIFSSMKAQFPPAQHRTMQAILPRELKRVWVQA